MMDAGTAGSRLDILFLNPSGQLGGAERSLLDMIASLQLARPGISIGLIVTAEGPLVGLAERAGVRVIVLPLPKAVAEQGDGGAGSTNIIGTALTLVSTLPLAALYAWKLRRLVGRLRPRIVHSNGLKMHILGSWARSKAIPLVWHIHDFVSRRPVMSILLRWHAKRSSAIIANSVSVADDLKEVCGDGCRISLMYNAVDLDAFSPNGPVLDLDRLSGLPEAEDGVVRVGLIATLGWWKGHDTFLAALARLPKELPWRAYIIGGALYETKQSQHSLDRLRVKAVGLGLARRLGFTGFLGDVPSAMRALDIVVHASTEPEAFGLVIIEGMASQRTVIASDAGGAAELIAGGVNALGHEPGNDRQLAEQIERLVRDPEMRSRIAASGRIMVERDFDRRRLARDLIPVYHGVGVDLR